MGTTSKSQHSRFQDAIWYNQGFASQVTLGGVGGIGSWLAFLLARAGVNLRIYDFDTIDESNMAGQLYPEDQIGSSKVNAVKRVCEDFSCTSTVVVNGRFDAGSTTTPIMISAFDNMAARKTFFAAWKSQKDRTLFVDGRMLAESGQVYFVRPGEEEVYEQFLFDDKDVKDQPCSMKATSHCGAHIASIMMAGFTNWITNAKLNADVREVPFKMDFELPLLNWTIKTANECKQSVISTAKEVEVEEKEIVL